MSIRAFAKKKNKKNNKTGGWAFMAEHCQLPIQTEVMQIVDSIKCVSRFSLIKLGESISVASDRAMERLFSHIIDP